MTSPARSTAEIIPVLDLMRGRVVRGIAGQRESYQPITSRLADSSDPLQIADAFASQLGLDRIYLADLDAIENNQPAWNEIERLTGAGHRLMVDAGLRDVDRARDLVERGVETVVAGLETVPGPGLVRELVQAVGNETLVFSLDLKQGVPMAHPGDWSESTPVEIADSVIDAGVVRLIVLDLAGVGTGSGPPTLELCRRIRSRHVGIELITGGGIRGSQDISDATRAGADAVLVASALHDGSLLPD